MATRRVQRKQVQRMHTGFLKRKIADIGAAAAKPGIDIANRSGTEDVLPIEGSPTKEATDRAAEDDPFRPHDIPIPLIKKIICSVLSTDAHKASEPQIDEIGGSTEIEVTLVRVARTIKPSHTASITD